MKKYDNINELINKVEKYDYISFDLFDTLIFRTFDTPENVYDMVEYLYNISRDDKLINFKKIRYNAEIEARKTYGNREISINDIYSFIKIKDKEVLKKLEQTVEIENSVPNEFMLSVYNNLILKNKKVIIITDMYLDRDTIIKILSKNGIRNYHRLYLSSDIGYTKVEGKLFPYIISKMGIKAENIAHIGDNLISDIEMAKRAGIDAYERITPLKNSKIYIKRKNRSLLQNHMYNFCLKSNLNDTSASRIGYSVLGPIVMEFCMWIHEQVLKNNPDNILFIAREGYLINNIYLRMYPDDKCKVKYVKLNKNMLRLPMLHIEPTIWTLLDTMPAKKYYSLKEIADALYLSSDEVKRMKEIFGQTNEMSKSDLSADAYKEEFNKLFDILKERFELQYHCLKEYLISLGFDKKKIMMVNNSINGNGQKMVELISNDMGLKAQILGLQFVRSRKCKSALGDRSKGWISDSGIKSRFKTMKFNRVALLLEHLMFEKSGTAKYFESINTEKYIIKCADQGKESENNVYISEIQRFAIRYIENYMMNINIVNGNGSLDYLFDLWEHPIREDAEALGKLQDVDFDGTKSVSAVLNWKQATYSIYGKKNLLNELCNIEENLYDICKALISIFKDFKGKRN